MKVGDLIYILWLQKNYQISMKTKQNKLKLLHNEKEIVFKFQIHQLTTKNIVFSNIKFA